MCTLPHSLTDLLDISVRGADKVSGCRAAPGVTGAGASRVSLDTGRCVVIFGINYSLQPKTSESEDGSKRDAAGSTLEKMPSASCNVASD